jgi:hypothetical protein
LRNLRPRRKLRLQQVRVRVPQHSRRLLLTLRQHRGRPLVSLLPNNRQRLDNPPPQGSPQRRAQ